MELQSIFFSAIGHELKTPLTVLKTLVPSLRQLPALPVDTQTEITETIEQNLARLEECSSTTCWKVPGWKQTLSWHCIPARTNLLKRTYQVLDRLSPLLARKRQQVSLKAPPDLPLVWADGRRGRPNLVEPDEQRRQVRSRRQHHRGRTLPGGGGGANLRD